VIRSRAGYSLWSREAFLLLNNILLVIAMAMVLLGTLFPLAYEAVTGGDKVSIGPPYFNFLFVPLMLVAAAALGVVPILQWKRTRAARRGRDLGWVAAASVSLGVVLPLVVAGAVSWQALLALALGLWVVGSHAVDLGRRARLGIRRIPLAYWGMQSAHVGFAVTLVGVALTSMLSLEQDVPMMPGESRELGPVTVRFDGVSQRAGPNFVAQRGSFQVTDGAAEYQLHPEKRRYLARNSVMTEAAIDPGFTRDIYISLGEPLDDGAWAVRMQHKPFVRWIWLGGLLMAFGGALAVADARYRRLRHRLEERHLEDAPAAAAPTQAPAGGRA
jgi:cytochrome c-type biogenesis protein CcmF